MSNTALVIIDVQNMLIEEKPFQVERFISNIQNLIEKCRNKNLPIIYIRHNNEEFKKDTHDWDIHSSIQPEPEDQIFDKYYNSIFFQTNLKEHLQKNNIHELILCGMVAEYCVDASIKAAFEHGYKVYVAEGCTTTFGNELIASKDLMEFYEEFIWPRFSIVLSFQELFERI
ncbi:MAG: cysteine hydrolase family protein [Peptostreptococcaceae bacterium]|nr:cysteine hydrolase family protein [Peptostreptococcaceae bacterium]